MDLPVALRRHQHRNKTKRGNVNPKYDFWVNWPEEMYKKTVIRKALNYIFTSAGALPELAFSDGKVIDETTESPHATVNIKVSSEKSNGGS